jgi:hypothetical protein
LVEPLRVDCRVAAPLLPWATVLPVLLPLLVRALEVPVPRLVLPLRVSALANAV